MSVEENLRIIAGVDEAFNARDWDAFNERHGENVVAYSPMTPEPTRDLDAHREAVQGMFTAFSDFHMERGLAFGQDDWVFASYVLTGTHDGPLPGPDGQAIPPTNRAVRLEMAAAVRFENGRIAEERIFFDRASMMAQLGLGPKPGQ